jgi:hypothetical protein
VPTLDRGKDSAAPPPAVEPEPPRWRLRLRLGRRYSWPQLVVAALFAAIAGVGLWIRVRHNQYGLPYVYNYDEATHFTNRAVGMFGGNFDPRYYQNPSAYTYLMYAGLRLWFGVLGMHLQYPPLSQQFQTDPTPIWTFARTVTAIIAMLGVGGTFWVARRFWGARVGLAAAALISFAFLSVTYSRIAVTDVGTFLPIAVAIWAILRVGDEGRALHYVVAGAAIGFAIGFKYTCGLALVPLLIVAGVRFWRDRGTPLLRRRDLWLLVAACAALVVAFAITTPFFFIHPRTALYQLKQQAEAAGDTEKLGQAQQGGFYYYLSSFTWGFGWAAIVAALAGAVLEFRRNALRAILLVSFPVVLFLYMGAQTRYFGRWLLMIYPILAILAGIGIVRVAELVRGRAGSPRRGWMISGAAAAVLTALVLIQPMAADVRTSNVLGHVDTQTRAKHWLAKHFPDRLRIVIEPAVPDLYYKKVDKPNAKRRRFVKGFVDDLRRQRSFDAPLGADTTYASTLTPDLIDAYRGAGFCLVMTNSLIRGRAENAALPAALGYYRRLERESTDLLHLTPFKKGARPVPLHYDWSYDYYPTAYKRPGGIVDVYQLHNCTQQYGRVPERPYGVTGLQKGVGTSLPPS